MRDTTPVRGLSSRWDMQQRHIAEEGDSELRRQLGLKSATLLVVGGIIGSGIFFTPSSVARALPSGGWILLVWLVGGLVALAGALTYAELGAMLPDAGGPYVYLREAFGGLPAFLYGWMALASIATGAFAAVAMALAGYLERLMPLGMVGGKLGVAVIVIVLCTGINYLGIKPGAFAQNVFAVCKIAALGALIVGGMVLIVHVGAPVPVAAPAARASLGMGLAAAFVPVLFTIGGWQQMTMVGGEIREPEETIPRALVIGISIVIAIYLGANIVYLRALGRDGLAASSAVAADAATRYFGAGAGSLIGVAAMLSMAGMANVIILANSRIVYAMARDGAFFDGAARVHPRFGSPHIAVVIMGVWALTLLLATRGDMDALLSGVVFADWIFFGLGGVAVIVLRTKMPDLDRPYRVRGYPWVPAFFVAAAMVGVISSLASAPKMSLLGVALLVAGVAVYFVAQRQGWWHARLIGGAPTVDGRNR